MSAPCRSSWLLAAALVLAAVPAVAKSRKADNPQLESDLRTFFSGRELVTRLALPTTSIDSVQGQAVRRTVYTVVEPDGSVHYLMGGGMAGFFPLLPQPVSLGECEGYISSGRTVRVSSFDIDPSRVELIVHDMEAGTGVGVRIKFGEEGAAGAGLADVIDGVARIADLGPEWRQAEEFETAWDALDAEVQAAEEAWAASAQAPIDDRRVAGARRVEALRASLANREECGRLKGFACYGTRKAREGLEVANADVSALDAEEREGRIAALRSRVAEAATTFAAEIVVVEDTSRAVPERETAFERARGTVSERASLADEIAALQGDPAQERAALAGDEGRLAKAGADIAARQRARRHDERSRQWTRLGAEAAALRTKVDSGAGSVAERDASLATWSRLVADRRALLDEMILDDQGLPDGGHVRLAEESSAIERARAALATQRTAAKVAELDAAFARLEGDKAQALSRYGLAFSSPEQPARARDLLATLQRMLDNRRAAASLGSDAAATRASALQSEINQMRQLNPGL